MKVLGLSGSVRADSSCSRLVRAIASLAPEEMTFTMYDRQLESLPAFSPDLDGETAVAPSAVSALRQRVREVDAVLIVCPEYAHGVPGAFKNALDWLVSSGELGHKKTVVLMASPSGASFARLALLPTLHVLEANIVFESSVVLARKDLSPEGHLLSPALDVVVHQVLRALRETRGIA